MWKHLFYLFFILVISSSSHLFAKPKALSNKDIALCAIFQNEASYLREWIEFYRLVGVKHFFLYNHLSTDNYKDVLKPYTKAGIVTLTNWEYSTGGDGRNWPPIQVNAYLHALDLARYKYKWLIYVDTDEFLFPVEVNTLDEFLGDYSEFGSVCASWQMYGTSDVAKIVPGHLLIEDLIYKAPTQYGENNHVKCIVRPERVQSIDNPHFCVLFPPFTQVNANKEVCYGPFAPITVDKLRINHYWTRDEYFLHRRKIKRREGWQDAGTLARANRLNAEIDTSIHKYVPALKQALKRKPK